MPHHWNPDATEFKPSQSVPSSQPDHFPPQRSQNQIRPPNVRRRNRRNFAPQTMPPQSMPTQQLVDTDPIRHYQEQQQYHQTIMMLQQQLLWQQNQMMAAQNRQVIQHQLIMNQMMRIAQLEMTNAQLSMIVGRNEERPNPAPVVRQHEGAIESPTNTVQTDFDGMRPEGTAPAQNGGTLEEIVPDPVGVAPIPAVEEVITGVEHLSLNLDGIADSRPTGAVSELVTQPMDQNQGKEEASARDEYMEVRLKEITGPMPTNATAEVVTQSMDQMQAEEQHTAQDDHVDFYVKAQTGSVTTNSRSEVVTVPCDQIPAEQERTTPLDLDDFHLEAKTLSVQANLSSGVNIVPIDQIQGEEKVTARCHHVHLNLERITGSLQTPNAVTEPMDQIRAEHELIAQDDYAVSHLKAQTGSVTINSRSTVVTQPIVQIPAEQELTARGDQVEFHLDAKTGSVPAHVSSEVNTVHIDQIQAEEEAIAPSDLVSKKNTNFNPTDADSGPTGTEHVNETKTPGLNQEGIASSGQKDTTALPDPFHSLPPAQPSSSVSKKQTKKEKKRKASERKKENAKKEAEIDELLNKARQDANEKFQMAVIFESQLLQYKAAQRIARQVWITDRESAGLSSFQQQVMKFVPFVEKQYLIHPTAVSFIGECLAKFPGDQTSPNFIKMKVIQKLCADGIDDDVFTIAALIDRFSTLKKYKILENYIGSIEGAPFDYETDVSALLIGSKQPTVDLRPFQFYIERRARTLRGESVEKDEVSRFEQQLEACQIRDGEWDAFDGQDYLDTRITELGEIKEPTSNVSHTFENFMFLRTICSKILYQDAMILKSFPTDSPIERQCLEMQYLQMVFHYAPPPNRS